MVPDQLLMQMLVTWLAPLAPPGPILPVVADQENSAPAKQAAMAGPVRSNRPPLKDQNFSCWPPLFDSRTK